MKPTVGAKLRSTVCKAEAIVIRSPNQSGELFCGAAPMLVGDEAALDGVALLTTAEPGSALVGKRYVDAETGLELLCTKSGLGALRFAGRPLELKQAKPLPSSD